MQNWEKILFSRKEHLSACVIQTEACVSPETKESSVMLQSCQAVCRAPRLFDRHDNLVRRGRTPPTARQPSERVPDTFLIRKHISAAASAGVNENQQQPIISLQKG